MTSRKNKADYKKPELINIDDPAFDEKGLGDSFITITATCPKDKGCPIIAGCHAVSNKVCGSVAVCGSITTCSRVDNPWK
jgi:hypothetical protein